MENGARRTVAFRGRIRTGDAGEGRGGRSLGPLASAGNRRLGWFGTGVGSNWRTDPLVDRGRGAQGCKVFRVLPRGLVARPTHSPDIRAPTAIAAASPLSLSLSLSLCEEGTLGTPSISPSMSPSCSCSSPFPLCTRLNSRATRPYLPLPSLCSFDIRTGARSRYRYRYEPTNVDDHVDDDRSRALTAPTFSPNPPSLSRYLFSFLSFFLPSLFR